MKRVLTGLLFLACGLAVQAEKQVWPDGTPMATWFADTAKVAVEALGKQYVITEYGVSRDSSVVQTEAIQRVIDLAAGAGGGVVVVPPGTFLSGSLFFRQGTHLHLQAGGVLKGSDRIIDYPIVETRIEGETCPYFAALVNADGLDGFTITGNGTVNGNGLAFWQEFWIRRKWNPQCTNKDAQRPRLVYIARSKNVTVQDVRLVNSPFWTNHLYRCSHVRYLDCYIYAPTERIYAPEPRRGAPSSDAIDLDVCHDVLIRGCYMHVNDDAVVLKGGKGTFADKDETNGPNTNILIEKCTYGRVHGCLTLGSESLYDRNIVLRDCHATSASRVLWLKMRPDTPQHYEYVAVDGVTGNCGSFLVVRPWTQFYKPQEREDMPLSQCNNITMRRIRMHCKNFFDVGRSEKYALKDFTFEDIDVEDEQNGFDSGLIENTVVLRMKVNGVRVGVGKGRK
ncbi:MAG: exopolygalacturonase [Prevotella sp.]|nr:exopolygalacturonase [Prevotella sp.]